MDFIPSSITIKGRPIFCCVNCGTRAQGDYVSIEPASIDRADVQRAIDNIHPTHMPVGWACYGRPTYRCPSCN